MKVFIQIGANVGNDDFQRKIEDSSEKLNIILVEPNPALQESLLKNYIDLKEKHNIVICQHSISLNNDNTILYLYVESGHSSLLNRDHVNPVLDSVEVPSKSFNDLCEEHNITEIEYLSIDTEGLDYEILNSIDLSKIVINTIVFERWNIDDDDSNKVYRTGLEFLNTFIRPKFKNYNWEDTTLDGCPTYKLSLI